MAYPSCMKGWDGVIGMQMLGGPFSSFCMVQHLLLQFRRVVEAVL